MSALGVGLCVEVERDDLPGGLRGRDQIVHGRRLPAEEGEATEEQIRGQRIGKIVVSQRADHHVAFTSALTCLSLVPQFAVGPGNARGLFLQPC